MVESDFFLPRSTFGVQCFLLLFLRFTFPIMLFCLSRFYLLVAIVAGKREIENWKSKIVCPWEKGVMVEKNFLSKKYNGTVNSAAVL